MSSDYVVQYKHTWIENNCLFIKMEFCSDNLKNIMALKEKCFDKKSNQMMHSIDYFISCELLKELTECVQYLHESNPPVIHRDLKPENVLITNNNKTNGRFLKICDFGLVTDQQLESMSHTIGLGSPKYMAPEVNNSRYTNIADIYRDRKSVV